MVRNSWRQRKQKHCYYYLLVLTPVKRQNRFFKSCFVEKKETQKALSFKKKKSKKASILGISKGDNVSHILLVIYIKQTAVCICFIIMHLLSVTLVSRCTDVKSTDNSHYESFIVSYFIKT